MQFVLIAGMHRSGTSCITGELAACGLHMSHELLAADATNPSGYFEDPRLIAIHDRMLTDLGSNWMDPAPFRDGWLDHLENTGHLASLDSYLQPFREAAAPLLVKDPRIGRLLPLWRRTIERHGDDVAVLYIYRNCIEVAMSLWRRNNIPILHALQLWARYNLDIQLDLEDRHHAGIGFGEFLADNARLAAAMAEIGIELPAPQNLGQIAQQELPHSVSAESVARLLPDNFEHPLVTEHGRPSPIDLLELYAMCGGVKIAEERRHYATILSTLWTVVNEKKALEKKLDELRAVLGT